jgi:TonB family protein
MPTLETPPNPAPTIPPPPTQEPSSGRIRAGRFGELDHSELVHLLDSLDDERAKARFRESVYISLLFWMAVVVLLIFAPRYFPNTPRFVTPIGLKRDKELTRLNVPADVQRALDHAPRFKAAPKPPGAKAPEPQQAAPQAPAPAQQQAPPAQAAQPAAPAPPPVVQQSPVQQPVPQQQAALPSAPTPAAGAGRPNFGNQNQSARDQVQQATRGGGGHGGDYPPAPNKPGGSVASGMDILTDTQGVDFTAWQRHMIQDVYRNWDPLLPVSFFPPISKRGTVIIRITINADGSIADMKLEGPSGDVSLDKAAWGALTTEGNFPHLPKEFHGPSIEIRCTFQYNQPQ